MKHASLTDNRLHELTERFASRRIAVLGDFFLDKYLDVNPSLVETSVETGKSAHQVVDVRCSPGAAGTVVSNLAALGAAELHAVGFTGDDGEGYELRRGLEALGCETDRLIRSDVFRTPTYLKPRSTLIGGLSGEHSRYDTKNREAVPPDLRKVIIEGLDFLLPHVDGVIVLDQVGEVDGGVVSEQIRDVVITRARQHGQVIFWVDSRVRLHEFRGVMLKSNEYEVVGLRQPPPSTTVGFERVLEAARRLRSANSAPVAVTCGGKGVLVSDPEWRWVSGVNVEGETDSTGAGDSFNAGAVLALAAGASFAEAAVVGNLVASITVQQLATTGVARSNELPNQLSLWNQQKKEL